MAYFLRLDSWMFRTIVRGANQAPQIPSYPAAGVQLERSADLNSNMTLKSVVHVGIWTLTCVGLALGGLR